jgi:peptidyl-prolyl cis-trans isomerase NIMA-interacting 1
MPHLTRRSPLAALALALLLAPACKKEPASTPPAGAEPEVGRAASPKTAPPEEKQPAKKAGPDPATADIPLDEAAPEDAAKIPRAPKEPAAENARAAAVYLLVKFVGVKQGDGVTRPKDEALRRALRLTQAARRKGASLASLAERFSEVPKEERGASVPFAKGQMERAFEDAVFGMEPGQVAGPVETVFGYYVIERARAEEYQTAHILIQYKGAKGAPPGATKTKEEARKLAELIHKKALEDGADFAVLAARNSDSPSKIGGGVIKPIVPGEMPPDYDAYIAAVRELKENEISPVVETPFGFHVIKRLRLEYVSASHILISYEGSDGTPKEEHRKKREAEVLARKVWKEAAAKGADFAALAAKYSDDEETAQQAGDLGRFARGTKLPRLEQIAFGLKPGQISEPFETRLGFHILKRAQ